MSLKRKVLLGIAAAGLLAAQVSAITNRVDITNDSIPAGQIKSWVAANTYVLHGKVVVKAGSRLNIAAGTKILAAASTGGPSTPILIVARGGRIYATGTASNPIIFTSIIDTMANPLPVSNASRGLWGGINIYGRAPGNDPGGVADLSSDITINGYPDDSINWVTYGDSANATSADSATKNANDTSGVLQYVSIRYTGMADQSEIKGLMFLDVGRGTQVDHVEVFECNEDGINLTGGTVNLKYVISAFQAGDAVMFQGGYQGKLQYVLDIQDTIIGGSKNGCLSKWESDDFGNTPITKPIVYNFTGIGTGVNNPDTWKYKYGIYIKNNAAGTLANSIITQCHNYGLYVEDLCADNDTCAYHNSRARIEDGTLNIENNIFYGFGKGNIIDSICEGLPFLQTYITASAQKNDLSDPVLAGLSWARNGVLDPRPTATGPATQNVATVPNDGFFDLTTYRGAFAPTGPLWAAGWSVLSSTGIFSSASVPVISSTGINGKTASNMNITGKENLRQISWNQEHAGNFSVTLYATNGKVLKKYGVADLSPGAHTYSISIKDIPAGIYAIQVLVAGKVQSGLICKE